MKKTILIVDDEVCIHKILELTLGKDYCLIVKHNGLEALIWLEEGNYPALIICDLEMPYIDGESLIKNLKISEQYRDVPIILISGAEKVESVVKQMVHKPNCFFKKPFDTRELKSCVIISCLNQEFSKL